MCEATCADVFFCPSREDFYLCNISVRQKRTPNFRLRRRGQPHLALPFPSPFSSSPVNFNRSTTTVTASAVVPNPTLFLAPTAERDFYRSSAAVACTVTHYCTHEVAWAAAAAAAANIDSFPSFLPVLFMCRSETTNESSPFAPPLPPLSTEEKRIIEGEGAENTRNSLEQKRE